MAKVTSEVKKIKKTIEVEQKVYTLVLTEVEAKVLRALTGQICGSSVASNRKELDAIYYALDDVNIKYDTYYNIFKKCDVEMSSEHLIK